MLRESQPQGEGCCIWALLLTYSNFKRQLTKLLTNKYLKIMEEIVRNEVANEVANEVKKSIFRKAVDLVKDNKVVAITSGVVIAGGTAFLLWRNSKKKKAANQDKGNKPTPAVENTKPGNKPEETKEEKKEEESK